MKPFCTGRDESVDIETAISTITGSLTNGFDFDEIPVCGGTHLHVWVPRETPVKEIAQIISQFTDSRVIASWSYDFVEFETVAA